MAIVLPSKSQSFPHNILQGSMIYHQKVEHMDHSSYGRPSLPPISSLIEHVDKHSDSGRDFEHQRKASAGSQGHAIHSDRTSVMGSPRSAPPPTPPVPGPASFDFGRHSPRTRSPNLSSRSSYYGHSHSPPNTNHEQYVQSRSSYPEIPEPNQWSSVHQRRANSESSQSEMTRTSPPRYPDPTEQCTPPSNMPQQRPLPNNFPPPVQSSAQTLTPIDPQMTPSWQQHHHYYPAANPPTYTQSTDRYVCPTCQKPFSRPSSLKIHTYSHTGEKPYKCKHEGCGKFFSVRSNMKRHEKGCHGGESPSLSASSPQAA